MSIAEYLKHYFLVKDKYLNLALLSATIGGGFQAFSLWSIGIFYLRFFSITQMISDTIAILFPLTIFIVFYYLGIRSYLSVLEKQGPWFIIITFLGLGIITIPLSTKTSITYVLLGIILAFIIPLIIKGTPKILKKYEFVY